MTMTKTQQELVRQGYQALFDTLGVVDTIRFIQHFSPGQGDYTKERHEWLDQISLGEIFTSMKQPQEDDLNQYEEIIE